MTIFGCLLKFSKIEGITTDHSFQPFLPAITILLPTWFSNVKKTMINHKPSPLHHHLFLFLNHPQMVPSGKRLHSELENHHL